MESDSSTVAEGWGSALPVPISGTQTGCIAGTYCNALPPPQHLYLALVFWSCPDFLCHSETTTPVTQASYLGLRLFPFFFCPDSKLDLFDSSPLRSLFGDFSSPYPYRLPKTSSVPANSKYLWLHSSALAAHAFSQVAPRNKQHSQAVLTSLHLLHLQ